MVSGGKQQSTKSAKYIAKSAKYIRENQEIDD
jgi:hypothetical protein